MKEYYQYVESEAKKSFYNNNQYEELYDQKTGFKLGLEARYIKQEEVDYMGNQLIEALTPTLEKEEVIDRLECEPYYDENERMKSDEARIHAITRILNFFHVFYSHLLIYSNLDLVIKRGYAGKHICSPHFRQNLLKTSKLINSKDKRDSVEELKCIPFYTAAAMPGFTIYGPSGTGKSNGIEHILNK